MASSTLKPAAAALIVGALLVALVAFVATGTADGDLETEALATTTTTTSEPARTLRQTTTSTTTTTTEPGPRSTSSRPILARDVWTLDTSVPSSTTTTTTRPADPAPVRIPRPDCAASLGALSAGTAPFTGLEASIPAGLPAVVVKVSNNNSRSRAALIGLDQADIVFEERIEASATRFAAVFHSQLPPNVGPVRSGRTTDINILPVLYVVIMLVQQRLQQCRHVHVLDLLGRHHHILEV